MRNKVRSFVASHVLLVLFSCQYDFKAGGYASIKSDGTADTDRTTTGMADAGSGELDSAYHADVFDGGNPGLGGASGSGGPMTPDAAWSSGELVDSRRADDVATEPIVGGSIAGAGGTSVAAGTSASGGATARMDAGSAFERDASVPDGAPVRTEAGDATQPDVPLPVEADAASADVSYPDAQGGAAGTGGVGPQGGQGQGGFDGGQATTGSSGTNRYTPEKYLVLMDDQFVGHARLQEFVQWKTEKGYRVETITTSMIDPSGAPSHEQIASYLKGLPDEEYPRYLLIIGDADPSNGVAAYKFQSGGVPPEYSNLFAYPQHYSDRFILSKSELLPTVFGGRLPASNTSELTVMLDKILRMDKSPPDPASTRMYDRLLVAGELWPTPEGGKYVDRGAFAEVQDAAISYLTQAGGGSYKVDLALVQDTALDEGTDVYWSASETSLWKNATASAQRLGPQVRQRYLTGPDAAEASLNAVLATANAGAAVWLFVGRADTNGWWRPHFTSSEVASKLRNGTTLPLVISCASLGGVYYPPTGDATLSPGDPFAKSLLIQPDGGAYAVIGATDLAGSATPTHGILMAMFADYRSWLEHTTDPSFTSTLDAPDAGAIGMNEGEATHLGQILYFAQRYWGMDANYHLLGDPEASLVLHAPVAQTVSYPAKMSPGANKSITVATGDDGALVSLYGVAPKIHVAGRARGGLVTLPVGATGEGQLKITITGPGRMTYQGTVAMTATLPKGDVDGNGKVEAHDADMISRHSAGIPVYDLIAEAADVNCDGSITIVDALLVQQMAEGMNPAVVCGL